MKKKILLLALLYFSFCFSQKKRSTKMGKTTIDELQMTIYDKDSTAKALVLLDHANVYIDEENNYDFRTDYYKRIKIFHKSEFERATIKIILYKKQRLKNIKATTYNLLGDNKMQRVFLSDDKIYEKQLSENYKEITFTLPKIKEGSIIEYKYSVLSPYSFLNDWYFQEDIPKIKSRYTSAIPGNWKYNIRIVGFLKLTKDDATIKKRCIYVPGIGEGDCVSLDYEIDTIPAFEEEDYMLAKQNFISRLVFELISYTDVRGSKTKYTKTWKDADKTLKNNFLDGQTSKTNYFKKNLPKNILLINDNLLRAKKIYKHIQERLSWNEKNWTAKKIKVKNVYNEKTGSVDGINLALYNSLKAAKINCYLVMSSTRENGLPTKLYPVVNDFNYVIVKAVIDGQSYFLDATDDFLSFGQLPIRCLNGDGRVLNFKKGGYWEEIVTKHRSSSREQVKLKIANSSITGQVQTAEKGYFAYKKRIDLFNKSSEEYLDYLETQNPNIEANNLTVEHKGDNEKDLKISYNITLENNFDNNTIKFNPFIFNKISKNPFKLRERNYPVDFGYKRSNTYVVNIIIPENLSIKKLPKEKRISLPNNGGRFILNVKSDNSNITVFSKLDFNKAIYSSKEYYYLKEFFNQIIKTQKNLIELEKN